MTYCNCEFGCDCEATIARLELALDLACKNRAEISGDPKMFREYFLRAADAELARRAARK